MFKFKKIIAGISVVVLSFTMVQAKTTITCLTNSGHLARHHKPLVEAFNAMQKEVEVRYAAPAKDYADTHLKLMRASATNTLPDCAFEAYNQLPALVRAMANRHQIVDLGVLIDKEASGWLEQNYSKAMLSLGKVDGIQYGMPFNASLIQWFYNADLFKQAGLDPDHFPTTWNGLFAAAKKLKTLKGITPMFMWMIDGDDWGLQTLIEMQGGDMVSPDGKKVIFDENNYAVNAMKLARRLVTEGGMRTDQDRHTQENAFTNGQLGIWGLSPASSRSYAERVGQKFDLRSAVFTLWNEDKGRLPAGGNAIIITTKNPEKVAAVWKYIKFMTGPYGQQVAAKITGYLPTNKATMQDQYLGKFYRSNPYYATPVKQYDRAGPWYGYPGTQNQKIWSQQRSVIKAVMDGKMSPQDGAAELKSIAVALSEK